MNIEVFPFSKQVVYGFTQQKMFRSSVLIKSLRKGKVT